MRPLGQITDDLESILIEMAEEHEMQWGEILSIIKGYFEIHLPESQEQYDDGTVPIFYYGHKDYKK